MAEDWAGVERNVRSRCIVLAENGARRVCFVSLAVPRSGVIDAICYQLRVPS